MTYNELKENENYYEFEITNLRIIHGIEFKSVNFYDNEEQEYKEYLFINNVFQLNISDINFDDIMSLVNNTIDLIK
jgi:hypothetical protein